jgi:hypothetical protein
MSELMLIGIAVVAIVIIVFVKTWHDVSNPKKDVSYEQISRMVKKDIEQTEQLLNDMEEEEVEEE